LDSVPVAVTPQLTLAQLASTARNSLEAEVTEACVELKVTDALAHPALGAGEKTVFGGVGVCDTSSAGGREVPPEHAARSTEDAIASTLAKSQIFTRVRPGIKLGEGESYQGSKISREIYAALSRDRAPLFTTNLITISGAVTR
jgi:hypothetical protein